jgi:hypothetical protein
VLQELEDLLTSNTDGTLHPQLVNLLVVLLRGVVGRMDVTFVLNRLVCAQAHSLSFEGCSTGQKPWSDSFRIDMEKKKIP